MSEPSFTWLDIINAANDFLSNEFVAGILIAICALALVSKIADFLKELVEH